MNHISVIANKKQFTASALLAIGLLLTGCDQSTEQPIPDDVNHSGQGDVSGGYSQQGMSETDVPPPEGFVSVVENTAKPNKSVVYYQCGEQNLIARFNQDQLSLISDMGPEAYSRVESASGEKYTNESGESIFWVKGEEATLMSAKGPSVCLPVTLERILASKEWVVEDINGKGVIDFSRATLNFGDEGALTGRASCNSYRSAYTLTANHLTVEAIASTKKLCPPALMNQEQAFLENLATDNLVEFDETGALVLKSSDAYFILAR